MPRFQRLDADKLLGNVPDQYAFYTNDGRYLRNLDELRIALETMSDQTFAYHNNEQKKDFSNWVKEIIGDEKLARDLSRAADRSQAIKAVISREAFLKSRVAAKPEETVPPAENDTRG